MTRFKLDTCVWELTRRCNFNCAYCGTRAGKKGEGELTFEESAGVAQQLIDMKCRRVVIIGGEAFLYSGWDKICKMLTSAGVDTSIITNGALVDEGIVRDLKNAGIKHVSVSIDGAQEVHDKYRTQGSFDKAVAAIKLLKSNGIVTSVISTLNAESAKTLQELADVLLPLGIEAWQMQACSPFGNAADRRSLIMSKDDMAAVCDFVYANKPRSKTILLVADNIGYHTEKEQGIRLKTGGCFGGCSAGITVVGIDSLGNVRGCESLYADEFIEGNLKTQTLYEIWNSPDSFAYNRKFTRDMLTGRCADCEMWYRCAGGCRSFNYFNTGKMYESAVCLRAALAPDA
ncbi:MAG: radical SAM protein [Eubacterium sp.]|nr:radical SAM protein [Eubacterium sp.]MBR0412066.1 radical SAM protein [Eubacterium sp.]